MNTAKVRQIIGIQNTNQRKEKHQKQRTFSLNTKTQNKIISDLEFLLVIIIKKKKKTNAYFIASYALTIVVSSSNNHCIASPQSYNDWKQTQCDNLQNYK